MKNVIASLLLTALTTFFLTPFIFAGGIDNKHNYSAEYVRTLNRNAATDSADAVVYNPAGVIAPAIIYVNVVIPAPNQVRDKLQPESTMISTGCRIKSGMTIDVFNRRSNTILIED